MPLKPQSLRPSHNLAGKVSVERVDGTARQGLILAKQVTQNFGVVIAAIGQDGNHSGHKLDDLPLAVKVRLREIRNAIALNRNELMVAEKIEQSGDHYPHAFRSVGNSNQHFIYW